MQNSLTSLQASRVLTFCYGIQIGQNLFTYTQMRASLVLVLYLCKNDQHQLRPLEYASQEFSPTRKRWSTREQEFYAIKSAVEQCRHNLLGRKFIVETDHANLKWLCSIAPHKDKLRHAGYPHLLNTILNYVTALVAGTHSCCPFTLRRNPVYPV